VLLYEGNPEYSRGIEPAFRKQYEEALGGSVAAVFSLADAGWRERSAAALGATGIGAVYIVAYAEETVDVLRHLAEQQFAGRVVATVGVLLDAGDPRRRAARRGRPVPLPPFDRTSEKEPVLSFVNHYMETYNRAPDVFAAHGYDAMRYSIEVMRAAKPSSPRSARRCSSGSGTSWGHRPDRVRRLRGSSTTQDVPGQGRPGAELRAWLDSERSRIYRDIQNILINRAEARCAALGLLWRHRALVAVLVRRELTARYGLGARLLLVSAQPAAAARVYAVVFTSIFQPRFPAVIPTRCSCSPACCPGCSCPGPRSTPR